MAGYRGVRQSGSSSPDFVVYKTDLNGQVIGPNDFFMGYTFWDGCTLFAPQNCSGVSIVESQGNFNNKAYALAAQYDKGIAFGALDPQGNVVQQLFFDFPSFNFGYNPKPAIRESVTNPDFFYICGNFRYDSAFVMKIDATQNPPAVVWSYYYTILSGIACTDLIESPYTNDELIVVGRCEIPPFTRTAEDAFFMKLSSIGGSVLTFSAYNKAWEGDEIFNSIEIAQSPNMGSNGYILGGKSVYTNVPPCNAMCNRPQNRSFTQWFCKLDPNGAVLWSSLIEPKTGATFTVPIVTSIYTWVGNVPPGIDISRVWERKNQSSGAYEYFGVSTQYCWPLTTPGTYIARNHIGAFKLDDNGSNTFSPNEFHYLNGPPYNTEVFHKPQITGLETGGGYDDGLRMFSSDLTDHNFVFLKTYFNGVAGCTDTVLNLDSIYPGPDSVSTSYIQVDPFPPGCVQAGLITSLVSSGATTICSASSVSGGNNARLTAQTGIKELDVNQIVISPNPTFDFLRINNISNRANLRELSILDNLGRKLYLTSRDYVCADSSFEVDCRKLGLKSGIYFVVISFNDGYTEKSKFIYQIE